MQALSRIQKPLVISLQKVGPILSAVNIGKHK